MKNIFCLAILISALTSTVAIAENKYDDAATQATKNLNKSLGSVGQRVVLTVSSPGQKDAQYFSKYDKYSPAGETIDQGCIELSKQIKEAVERAKSKKTATTIKIKVEVKN